MSMCPHCGECTIMALTPGGRVVDIDFDHAWVPPGAAWPRGLFILGISGREGAIPHAMPALDLVDRGLNTNRSGNAGPFRREHRCESTLVMSRRAAGMALVGLYGVLALGVLVEVLR